MNKIPPKYKKQLNKDKARFTKNIEVLLKKGKGKKIKEEIFHKVKAGDRRREIELQKLDNEIEYPYWDDKGQICYKGTHSLKRQEDKRNKKAIWWAVGIFIAIVISYPLAIALYDLLS